MLRSLFEEELYIKISRNRFEITRLSDPQQTEVVSSPEPFTTTRLLIGEFGLAEHHLKMGIRKVLPKTMIKRSPAVLIHPVEMTEGGLSEVEVKVFREIALGAGAHKVVVWDGAYLTPDQASGKLKSQKS